MGNTVFYASKSYLLRYPAPKNLGYFWNFGSLSVLFLIVQLITGLFLAMFYTPHVELAFESIEHLMNDVYYGWLVRYMHANGASFFFFIIYIHILRGLYYRSYQYPRTNVWISGITIYFILMGTAFLGYVLPW
jgi:quinol-cytochrome oxidoreductase complex cytochrome b subunit